MYFGLEPVTIIITKIMVKILKSNYHFMQNLQLCVMVIVNKYICAPIIR